MVMNWIIGHGVFSFVYGWFSVHYSKMVEVHMSALLDTMIYQRVLEIYGYELFHIHTCVDVHASQNIRRLHKSS